MNIIIQILSEVSGIMLPMGFTFGTLILFLWSLPLLGKLIKSLI